MAPAERMRNVSARVSTPSIATTPPLRSRSVRLPSLCQLLGSRHMSRTTRPESASPQDCMAAALTP
jgi:hypothetical protein